MAGFHHQLYNPVHRHSDTLLCTSLKGIFNRRGHLKQYNSIHWSSSAFPATRFPCLCFFGRNTRKKSKNEESSSKEIFNRSLLQGRWTNVLLATNTLMYVGQIATQGELMLWGAKINNLIDDGELWRLVTSSFLHADVGHLLVNCYSLYSVGPTVENLYGPQRFFTIYLTSGFAGAAMSYGLSEAPAVGASGAIFGLVGSITVFSMRHRNVLGSGAQDLRHIASVIALNMIIGLLSPGIDNWGHLGGLLGGAAVSWIIGSA